MFTFLLVQGNKNLSFFGRCLVRGGRRLVEIGRHAFGNFEFFRVDGKDQFVGQPILLLGTIGIFDKHGAAGAGGQLGFEHQVVACIDPQLGKD